MDKYKSKVILDEDEEAEEVKPVVKEVKSQPINNTNNLHVNKQKVEMSSKDKAENLNCKDKNIGSKPIQPINKNELLNKLQNAIKSGAPNTVNSSSQVKKPSSMTAERVNGNKSSNKDKDNNPSFLNKKRVIDDEDEEEDSSYKDDDSNESKYDSESYETYTEESDSCSDSSGSSSSESSSSGKKKKEKKKISPPKAGTKFIPKVKDVKPKEKQIKQEKPKEVTSVKSLKTKESLVYSLLKRWWYAIDVDWYKQSISIDELLTQKGLRKIEILNWKCEDNIKNGLKKCIELKGFPLVFLDCDDNFHDLRNMENCPSYNNLIKKDKKDLCELNIKAIKAQIEKLDSSTPYIPNTTELRKDLEEELGLLNKEIMKF